MNFLGFDLTKMVEVLQASTPLAVLSLGILAAAGVVIGGWVAVVKLIAFGTGITQLLGNHLRHDIADVNDKLTGTNRRLDDQTEVLREVASDMRGLRAHLERTPAITQHINVSPPTQGG